MIMDDDPPPGFRFYPTEEELVLFYLHHKLNGTRPEIDRVIPLLHIYDYHPSDLPKFAGEGCGTDSEQWFFFSPRQEREARGGRPNRLTTNGYWKATGSPGDVYSTQNRVIGRKKTMVFYLGRSPRGRKTAWKMNEYKVIEEASSSSSAATPQVREELSLCRIYKRSKFLRLFDRRPFSSQVLIRIGDPSVPLPHHQQDDLPNNVVPADICNDDSAAKPVNNRDDDALDPSHSMGSDGNRDMDGPETELFWDLEQFGWFDL